MGLVNTQPPSFQSCRAAVRSAFWVCLWRVRSVRSSGGRPRTRRPARDFVRAVSGRACSRFGQYSGRSRPHVPLHPCRYLGRSRPRRTRRTPASRSTSLHCNPSTPPSRRPSAGAIAHRVLFRCLLASFKMTHAGGHRPAAESNQDGVERRHRVHQFQADGRGALAVLRMIGDPPPCGPRAVSRAGCQAFFTPALGQVIRPRRPLPPSAARRPAGTRAPRRARRVS